MDQNNVPIFKSLTKVVTWGGIPRSAFIGLVLLGVLLVVVLHSLQVLLPVAVAYLLIMVMFHIDHHIFGILQRNLSLKSHYLPD